MTMLVGVTGGIGSGKSLVCTIFEKLGIPVYKADNEAKRLMNELPTLQEGIKTLLGLEAYENGVLNRAFVAEKVFGNTELLEALNALVHPAVAADFEAWVVEHSKAPYVVKEAAILIETGQHKKLDRTVLVVAPEELRIDRVMQRDSVSREQVLARIGQQMPEEEKHKHASDVLVNDENSLLIPQVVALHEKFVSKNAQA